MRVNFVLSWRVARTVWFVVLAGCIASAAFSNLIVVPSDSFDLPIAVISAARVAKGEMPFRDFDAYYGPLGHYVFAAAISLQSGVPITTACRRLFFVLSLVDLALLGWWIPQLAQRRAWLLLWGAIFLCVYGSMIGTFSFHSGLELFLILGTLLVIPAETAMRASVGAVIVLAALDVTLLAVKVNFGGYAIAAAIFLLLLDALVLRRNGSVRSLAVYGSALLGFAGIFAGVMWISGMLLPYARIISTAIRLNYARHVKLTALQPPSLIQCLGLLLLFAILGVLTVFDPILRRSRLVVYSLALCVGFAHYATFRFDRYHVFFLLFGLFVAVIVALVLYDGSPQRSSRTAWLAVVALATLFVAALPDSVTYSMRWSMEERLLGYLGRAAPVSTSTSLHQPDVIMDGVAIGPGESRVATALLSAMNPNDEVFWASKPGSCQSVFDNCVNNALYLAMNKLPTTRYWLFDVVTSQYSEFQQRMVHEIEARKVRFIGVEEKSVHPPLGRNPPESHILYDFVQAHYRLMGTFDAEGRAKRFEIYRLNTP